MGLGNLVTMTVWKKLLAALAAGGLAACGSSVDVGGKSAKDGEKLEECPAYGLPPAGSPCAPDGAECYMADAGCWAISLCAGGVWVTGSSGCADPPDDPPDVPPDPPPPPTCGDLVGGEPLTEHWSDSISGDGHQITTAVGIGSDGTVFTGGSSADGGHIGEITLSSSGSTAYVAARAADGSLLSARLLDGASESSVDHMAPTMDGVAVAGMFSNSILLGEDTLSSSADQEVFVAQLDGNLTPQWAIAFDSAGGNVDNEVSGLVTDQAGGVTLAANVFGDTVIEGKQLNGKDYASDIVVAKLADTGALMWARRVGSKYGDTVDALAQGAEGSVVMIGKSGGFKVDEVQVEPGLFLLRLDADGQGLWTTKCGDLGPSGWDVSATSLHEEADGSYVVAGYFHLQFGCDGVLLQGPKEQPHNFVMKLDASGAAQWAVDLGARPKKMYGMEGPHVAVDAAGNVVVYSTLELPHQIDGHSINPSGKAGLLIKLSSDGVYLASATAGAHTSSLDLALDELGNAIVVGGFFEYTCFHEQLFGDGGNNLDGFVAKLAFP